MKIMNKTAIFYSFNTKNSSKAAEKIIEAYGESDIDTVNVNELSEDKFLSYNNLILSAPTWFDGELPNYWDEFVPTLEELDLTGKKVAIFGMGDQLSYPENFGDAVGILASLVEKQGAKVIGSTSSEGYSFEKSRANVNGIFLGLLLDAENQDNLTDRRIKDWVDEIKVSFKN